MPPKKTRKKRKPGGRLDSKAVIEKNRLASENLNRIMETRGIKNIQLANEIRCHPSYISQIRTGEGYYSFASNAQKKIATGLRRLGVNVRVEHFSWPLDLSFVQNVPIFEIHEIYAWNKKRKRKSQMTKLAETLNINAFWLKVEGHIIHENIIREGDYLLIEPENPLSPGDPVIYLDGGNVHIMHYSEQGNMVILKGFDGKIKESFYNTDRRLKKKLHFLKIVFSERRRIF